MTEERKKAIAQFADKVRSEHFLIQPDFNLLRFLTDSESFEIQLKKIEDNTTGLLFVDDKEKIPNSDSNRVIVINKNIENDDEFEQKRRFICAHEYGHFLLHRNNKTCFARRDTKEKDSDEEQEAEYFAYCLLLPEKRINSLFKNEVTKKAVDDLCAKYNMSYAEIVAAIFNVSLKKATCRLNELKVIQGADNAE